MAVIDGNQRSIGQPTETLPQRTDTPTGGVSPEPDDRPVAETPVAPGNLAFQDAIRDGIEHPEPHRDEEPSPLPEALQIKLGRLTGQSTINAQEANRLTAYINALQQKSGGFYTELALDYLLKNPKQAKHLKSSTKAKIHKLIEKDVHRQEQAKTKLVKSLTQYVDKAVGDDALSARRLKLSTWYDAEIRTQVHALERVDAHSKNRLLTTLGNELTTQARQTGVFTRTPLSDVEQAAPELPEGTLNAASRLREIDLSEKSQLAQTLRAVLSFVKPLDLPDAEPFAKRALTESIRELDSQLEALTNSDGKEAEIHAASALNTLNNILQLDRGQLLSPTDRENLELFSGRLKEVALRPVVEAFKKQLHHELEYLDEVGSRREIYITAKLGIGSKEIPALGTLGLSASLKVKLELRHNDYHIKEYKAFTTGLGANAGQENGLFNFAGKLSRTQSHVKIWTSLDDFIEHHSDDILANVVNLSASNVARIFKQKTDRSSASQLKDLEKTRASDLQKLNGRLQALNLLDWQQQTIKDGAKVNLPRYTAVREFNYAAEGEASGGFGAVSASGLVEKRTAVAEVLTPITQAVKENPALLDAAPAAHFDSKQGEVVVNTRELFKTSDKQFDALYDYLSTFEIDTSQRATSSTLDADIAQTEIDKATDKLHTALEGDAEALADALAFSKAVLTHAPAAADTTGLAEQHENATRLLAQQLHTPLVNTLSDNLTSTLDAELQQFKEFETLVLRAHTTTDSWVGNLAEQGVHDILARRGADLGVHDYLRAVSQSTAALALASENLPEGPKLDAIKSQLAELHDRVEQTNIYLNQEEQRHAAFLEGSRVYHRVVSKAEAKIALPLINIGKVGIAVTGEARWNENSVRDGRYLDIDITLPTLAQLPAAWDGLFTQLSEHGLVDHNLTGILEGDFKELLAGHGEEAAEGASGGKEINTYALPKFKVEAELGVKFSYQIIDGKPRLLYSHVATERAYEAGVEAEVPLGHAPVVLNAGLSVGKESTVPVRFNYGTGTLQFLIGQYFYWAGADTDQLKVSDRKWHEVVEHHPNNLVALVGHTSNQSHQVHKELVDLVDQGKELNLLSPDEAAGFRQKLATLSTLVPEGSKRADVNDATFQQATDLLREFLALGHRVHDARSNQILLDNVRDKTLGSSFY